MPLNFNDEAFESVNDDAHRFDAEGVSVIDKKEAALSEYSIQFGIPTLGGLKSSLIGAPIIEINS